MAKTLGNTGGAMFCFQNVQTGEDIPAEIWAAALSAITARFATVRHAGEIPSQSGSVAVNGARSKLKRDDWHPGFCAIIQQFDGTPLKRRDVSQASL